MAVSLYETRWVAPREEQAEVGGGTVIFGFSHVDMQVPALARRLALQG